MRLIKPTSKFFLITKYYSSDVKNRKRTFPILKLGMVEWV